jgi:hypothetical protein
MSSRFAFFIEYHKNDKIKNDEMGSDVACIGDAAMHTNFWSENRKGRHLLEDLCVDGRTILRRLLNTCGVIMWTEDRKSVV